jgi:membrane protein implicated in regulation of membrane protease activity
VNGERWIAKSSVSLPEGTEVEVIGVAGATLEVKPLRREVPEE